MFPALMQLLRKLADGSMVEAFLAEEGAKRVLVQIARPWLDDPTRGRLLDSSSDLISQHEHPDLLQPRTLRITKSGRWVVSSGEITGWTAADLLQRSGPVPEALVLEWAVVVCEALEALHARGQSHGCLAPRHLHLFGEATMPQVRLLDTTLLHLRGELDATTTVVEPQYLSPERASGLRGTRGSDVWGLGALLFELLLGVPLIRGRTRDESRELARKARAPRLPRPLERWQAVVDGCLEPLPINRFASALEVRQALLAV